VPCHRFSRKATFLPRELTRAVNPASFGWKAHYLGLLAELGYKTPKGVAYCANESITPPAILEKAGSLAVRSSGLSEDSVTSSSAGSFLTELDVKFGSVEATAARVRASASGKPMGVVVQELVPATISGVAFSVDPTSYSLDSWAVSWVEGSGAKLVSGHSTANDVLVD
jgi:hypothetical protein